MATHKSAKKRIRTSARKAEINKRYVSKMKTSLKKAMTATQKEEAEKLYKEAVAVLDRASTKGLIHKNNAARKKATLTKRLNSLQAKA